MPDLFQETEDVLKESGIFHDTVMSVLIHTKGFLGKHEVVGGIFSKFLRLFRKTKKLGWSLGEQFTEKEIANQSAVLETMIKLIRRGLKNYRNGVLNNEVNEVSVAELKLLKRNVETLEAVLLGVFFKLRDLLINELRGEPEARRLESLRNLGNVLFSRIESLKLIITSEQNKFEGKGAVGVAGR
jgi:hypothetical protein